LEEPKKDKRPPTGANLVQARRLRASHRSVEASGRKARGACTSRVGGPRSTVV